MNPDEMPQEEPQSATPAPTTPANTPPSRNGPSLEMSLAKRANQAIQQGADPKAVGDVLTTHIRYVRSNPVVRQQAENALHQGADPSAVLNTYFQVVASDPMAATHIAAQSGKLARVTAAQNAADVGAAQDAADADTYGSRFGKLLERKVGILAGNTPATLLTMGARRLAGSPISRQDAAQEVARDVEEAGQNEPGVNLPLGLGRMTMTDIPTAMLGYKAVGRTLGLNPAATGDLAKIGAVYEGGKRLLAPEEESGTQRVLGSAGHAALGYFTPRAAEGAGSLVRNIGQRTGATDFLGALAQKVGLDRVAENIGTKGAVNDILRVRQRIIDALGVPAETADQYLDAMVKQGRAATAPAYAAAKETASTVEAAPGKAATKLSELWQQAKTKLLPGAGETVKRPYEGPSHAEAGYQGSDLLDDVMHRMEAQKQSAADALTDAMRDAKGKYAPADISKAMDALGISRAGTPFGSSPMTLEQGAKHNYTWPVGESPGAPAIQSSEPGAPNFREADYTRPTPVKLRAANDVNVRRPATPEAVPEPSSTAPNIPAIVEQARTEAFAHPQVQRYLKQLYREAPELKGQTGYDVADQLKRDMNRDWGALKPADRAGEYGGSLREAKGLVQDYLDALSEGKAGEANAVHRAEVAVPREFFLRGSKLNVTPKGKALETNSLAALENDIARLPSELQDIARNAARAGRAADVVQTLRAQGVPETQSKLLTGLDFDKIRPAFKTEAEFQAFVQKVAQMRQAAAAQEARFGPPTGVRSFYKPQNPLATPRGIGLRTMAEGTPMASPPPAMPPLSSLWNPAMLAPSVVSAKR